MATTNKDQGAYAPTNTHLFEVPAGDYYVSTAANADDSNGSPNAEMVVMLPTDGTYRVRVNGYLSAGTFTLTVDALVR